MDRGAKDQLKSIVERIEHLEAEKQSIADDIKEIYAEAKGNGYDTKALRAVIRLRKLDADERREQQQIIETYMHALGMLADLPLGEAAIKRAASGFKKLGASISVGTRDGTEATASPAV